MNDQMGDNREQDDPALRAMVTSLQQRIEEMDDRLAQALEGIATLEQEMAAIAARRLPMVDCSPAGFPYLARGINVNFAQHADGGRYLAWGWWSREDWGVWGSDQRHAIRFALDNSYQGGYVDVMLTVQVTPDPTALPPQVTCTANGHFLRTLELKGHNRRLHVRIPPAAVEDGDILLCFDHDHPVSGQMLLGNGDERIIGLGIIALEIR